MTKIIGDISRAFPGSELTAVNNVREFCKIQRVETEHLIVVARAEHFALKGELSAAEWVAMDGTGAPAAVAALLQRLVSIDTHEVSVLSFSGEVLSIAERPWGNLRVRTYPMTTVRALIGRTNSFSAIRPSVPRVERPPVNGEVAWTFNHLSTLDEALKTFLEVLRQRGARSMATSVRQTTMRPRMGFLNPKFAGNASTTRSTGMVGVLLSIAVQRGLVEVSGEQPGDFWMWLKEETPTLATRSDRIAEPPSPAGAAPTSNLTVTSDASGGGQAPAARKLVRDVERYRSHKFSAKLEESRVGPFPDARPFVYEALSQLIASGPPQAFADLVSTAVDHAKKLAVSAGRSANQPWPAVRKVMERLLLRAGAVLDEGGVPLPNSWTSGKTVVFGLADRWQVKTDAEIVFTLIEKVADVSGDDVLDIARSLYHSPKSDARNSIYDALEYLIETNRIVDDGQYFRLPQNRDCNGDDPTQRVTPVH